MLRFFYVSRKSFFRISSLISLFLCALVVVMHLQSLRGTSLHWVDLALDGKHIAVANGTVEFGRIFPSKPYISPPGLRGAPPFRITQDQDGFMKTSEDTSVRSVTKIIFRFEKIEGSIVPAWGYHYYDDEVPRMWNIALTVPYCEYIIPLIYLELFFAFLPVMSVLIFAYRLFQSTPIGICLNCGYDLRATPSRCPECGTEPK